MLAATAGEEMPGFCADVCVLSQERASLPSDIRSEMNCWYHVSRLELFPLLEVKSDS